MTEIGTVVAAPDDARDFVLPCFVLLLDNRGI
jgi:hypothetical protein